MSEDGSISTSHALEAIEYKSFESNQQELVTIHADQSVEVGSGSLPGSKDCLGPSFTSDFERGCPVTEQKACEELLKSLEEQFETKDREEVENGFTNITQIASYDLVGLENNCNVELPTEVNLIDSSKSEPEAFLVSNSQLEVPEPKDKCIILKEEIRLKGKELENGEKSIILTKSNLVYSQGWNQNLTVTNQKKILYLEMRLFKASMTPIPEVKQENSGEFLATENPTIDFTSWIAEALVSMNNLEAEMLGQQVTQHNEAHQAEAAAAAESKTLAEVETSSVSVSSGSETLEFVGRSSTVSTESDPDNLNIVHAQIQNLELQP
ncbi:hypothetical protein J5N97_000463 [Dioscorea zingiberensis]|uniref:Uncharacterized protein n=1 Tax=Dioscorea zingiberensis TaxID=325984 RepID=A0A9D5BSK2_9LILI|nr:hypothetical protein J5N97_000463 [Dioscorea zingiberensis]